MPTYLKLEKHQRDIDTIRRNLSECFTVQAMEVGAVEGGDFFFNPTINPIKLDEKCAAILRYEVNITATEISDLKLVQHCVDY